MTKTILKSTSNQNDNHFDFGSVDSKGRKIGANINIATVEYVPFVEGEIHHWYSTNTPEGVHFTFRPHLTRDGKRFGPAQDRRYFNTEAERQEAIEAYLASAKKRHA